MRAENGATMMVDDDARIIDDALSGRENIPTQKRILAGPEVDSIAADFPKKRLAHKEVAARIIFAVAPLADRLIPIAVIPRDEKTVVDAPPDSREIIVAGRRDSGASDGTDRRVAKELDRPLEPLRRGVRIVIDKGDDLAFRFMNAAIALFGGSHLARLLIVEHENLEGTVGLPFDRRETLLKHPARLRAGNDNRHERP